MILLACARLVAQTPDAGVSRALAVERAGRVSGVRYGLEFTLLPRAAEMAGLETLRFTLTEKGTGADLALDFRDGGVGSVVVNGAKVQGGLSNGHLMLPAGRLRTGENTVAISFTARIAKAGAAMTRYEDKDDGGEYVYSLFVPMDASMAFPCFDQPDLKGEFRLSVKAPREWAVIGNTKAESVGADGGSAVTRFPETRPISTYLFAFAAGPWTKVHPTAGEPDVYVRRSQVRRAEPEVPQLQEITARGMRWLAEYFRQPFPFPKYDIVLIPGFPFGGMEHAGATFLREDAVLFRTAPTASDRFGRNTLTLHELTHQWFGDLVTMRWFDDLWLKEGFAQYMAYKAVAALEPTEQPWKHFYEDIKPLAYGIDETAGTTPIYQTIPNLKDAKSAYGAIVYQKAPAVLKQMNYFLGEENFRDGLRMYLKHHAYANAQWADLIGAFEKTGTKDVQTWAKAWILQRGMPQVEARFTCNAGKVASLRLTQRDVLESGLTWPMSNQVLLLGDAGRETIPVTWSTPDYAVKEAVGKTCPRLVFANDGDYGYGRFLLDAVSTAAAGGMVVEGVAGGDPLLRSQLWGALWENVHVAKSPPRGYVELVLRSLPHEEDETQARIQGAHATTALHFYASGKVRAVLTPRLEAVATERMLHAPTAGLRIVSFRTLTGVAETAGARGTLKDLLSGTMKADGVELRPLDRWNLVTKLMTLGDPEAQALFAAEQRHDTSGEGDKYAWSARAGAPDAASKQRYFAEYVRVPTDPAAKPEDWLTLSLRPFNAWNQGALTEPYLRRALDQLPEIKRDRKIFFLGAWLGAFLGGQASPAAEAVVTEWLAQPGIDADLRLKVLENADELHRTVRIRRAFPE